MADTTTQQYMQRETPEMEAKTLALLEDYKKLTSQAPEALPLYQVADLSDDQKRAAQMAREGIGAYQPYFDEAHGMMSQAGTAKYDPNSATAYMNPYQEQVTQKALQEMNRQAAIQQQSVSAGAAKAGAFGGSRFGVQQAELGRNLADVQGRQILSDYSNNYSQAQQAAMSAFQNQQARAFSAGQGLQSLGSAAQTAGQADTSFLSNSGATLQNFNQKTLDAQRMNQQMTNLEPYQRLAAYSDILNKTPSAQIGYNQTTAPSPSIISQGAGLLTAGIGAYRMANPSPSSQWGT